MKITWQRGIDIWVLMPEFQGAAPIVFTSEDKGLAFMQEMCERREREHADLWAQVVTGSGHRPLIIETNKGETARTWQLWRTTTTEPKP